MRQHLLFHRGDEKLEIVAPNFLGQVHRGVGVLDQVIGLFAVGRIKTDTDTDGNGDFVPFEQHRPGQGVDDFLRNIGDIVGIGDGFEDDGKFVATQARHRVVLAHAGGEALRHHLQ